MTIPILIAQTPRAGRFNHANLVPVGGSLPARLRPCDLLGAALTNPVGRDYLAVVRVVTQGETARTGREALVLAGIRPPADATGQASVIRWLETKLDELEAAVRDMNWDQHDGGDRECDLLNRWGDEAANRFQLKRPREPHRGLFLVALLAGLLFGGTVARYYQHVQSKDHPSVPKSGAADPSLATWERFKKSYPASTQPDIDAIKKALQRAGHDFPLNFDSLPPAKREEYLWKMEPFRRWLAKNFSNPDSKEFTPFLGDVSDDAKKELLLAGKLDSVPAVLRTRERLSKRAKILSDCRQLSFERLDEQQLQSDDLQLIGWAQKLRTIEDVDEVQVGLPFVSDKDRAAWKYVVEWDKSLRAALKKFDPKSRTPASLNKDKEAVAARTHAARGIPEVMRSLVDKLKDWPEDNKDDP